jgi:hypothetical protein
MNKMVYIQSVDLSNRYLSVNGLDRHIYLLPLSSDTTVFIVRSCFWKRLQQTYPNFTCISLESISEESRKYLQHGNHRVFLASSDLKESSNFVGDASFLLVGDTKNFRFRSTVAMQINTVIWLQYNLPNYDLYMYYENQIINFSHFRFVLRENI